MSLTLVAVPIGNADDISARALQVLNQAEVIIVEERKEGTRWLRHFGITGKEYLELNEHTSPEELQNLTALCAHKTVALITDAGTPGFCDPGAHLVAKCRQKNIAVKSVPGASSLMMLLSLSSQRIDQFIFRGFLPAENQAREKAWQELKKEKHAVVLMDTPYRLQKMLTEVQQHFPERKVLLGLDFTAENELIWEGQAQNLAKLQLPKKAEFMLLLYSK